MNHIERSMAISCIMQCGPFQPLVASAAFVLTLQSPLSSNSDKGSMLNEHSGCCSVTSHC